MQRLRKAMSMSARISATVVNFLYGLANWPGRRRRGDAGQATAEYALVLLAVAALALLVFTWVKDANPMARLFDAIFDKVINRGKAVSI